MIRFGKKRKPEIAAIASLKVVADMVSVVTASYNHGGFIEACIESVRGQNYPKVEHIVCDGGSSDQTVSILRKYPHLKWISEQDRGQSHALNKAINMARGEYIFWLNSDDEMLPGVLEDVAATFKSKDHPDVLVYGFEMINVAGDHIGEKLPGPRMKWMAGRFSPVDCFPTPAIAFRRSAPETIGGLDEAIRYPLDTEFLCRARAMGLSVVFVDRYAVRYRWDENSQNYDQSKVDPLIELYHMHRRFWPKGPNGWKYWLKSRVLRGALYQKSFVQECNRKRYHAALLSWVLFLLNQPEAALKKNTWGIFLRALGMR